MTGFANFPVGAGAEGSVGVLECQAQQFMTTWRRFRVSKLVGGSICPSSDALFGGPARCPQ
eukprot:959392-Alexandrium_andersonii.AAC.1